MTMASMTAVPFSFSACSEKENFPTGTATLPFLSSLNSTRPAFTSFTALAVSSVTVPVLGFGIRPRGPSTLPSLRTSDHGGRRGDRHIEILKASLALLHHILEADVLRARLASSGGGSAFGEDEHADSFARAVRQRAGAAHHLVGLAGIDAEPEGKGDRLVKLRGGHSLQGRDGVAGAVWSFFASTFSAAAR